MKASDLPPNVLESDTKYPSVKWNASPRCTSPIPRVEDRVVETLTFYKTTAFGWCIATLHISNPSRRATNQTARTYAVRCADGKGVRIGAGPHVTATLTVYVKSSRLPALQKYIDQYKAGQIQANEIRDRISSRRAEGAYRRGQGQRSWRWDT